MYSLYLLYPIMSVKLTCVATAVVIINMLMEIAFLTDDFKYIFKLKSNASGKKLYTLKLFRSLLST